MKPIHPGEVLLEEYMRPLGVSVASLAPALGLPEEVIQEIVSARRPVTAEIAEQLSDYFDTTPSFWLNLQALYEQSS